MRYRHNWERTERSFGGGRRVKVFHVCTRCYDSYSDGVELPEYGCVDVGHCRIVMTKFDNSTLTRKDITYPVRVEFLKDGDGGLTTGSLDAGGDYVKSVADALEIAQDIRRMLEFNGLTCEIINETGETYESWGHEENES
jgi:hypothetical protein